MKTCPNCGITLPDDASFCGVCGASTTPAATPAAPVAAPEAPQAEAPYVPPVYVAPPAPVAPVEEKKESISIGGWIGRDLIPCIPVVGGIIYFIMLWVWASDKSKEDSFRNWAKSRLIWMAIAVGILLVLVALLLGLGFTLGDVVGEALNY